MNTDEVKIIHLKANAQKVDSWIAMKDEIIVEEYDHD